MNSHEITIEECMEKFCKENRAVLLNDGQVSGFVKEECAPGR